MSGPTDAPAMGRILHHFTGAVLFEVKLTKAAAAMSASRQMGWLVQKAVKSGAILNGAILNGAILDGAILNGASLNGASLYRAILNGASLNGAILNGAILNGAILNGASLNGASLYRASLDGAILNGAILNGAILNGASLNGAKGVIDGGSRADGYRFVGWIKGGVLMIRAGCRDFTIAEAREHWTRTRGGTPLGAETTAILDHIEAVARIRGMVGAAQ